jgi:hypothetical protein
VQHRFFADRKETGIMEKMEEQTAGGFHDRAGRVVKRMRKPALISLLALLSPEHSFPDAQGINVGG